MGEIIRLPPRLRSMPQQKPGNSNQDYGTPRDFIAAVEARFGPLAFDLAATRENTKARAFYTPEQDALKQDWRKLSGNLWLNPPFGHIALWAKKCAETGLRPPTRTKILLLVPASIGANWFVDFVFSKALVLALNGRLTFEGETQPYPKDCMLACYGVGSGFNVWTWR